MFIPKDSDGELQDSTAIHLLKRSWASKPSLDKAVPTSPRKKRLPPNINLYGQNAYAEPLIQLKTEAISESLLRRLSAINVDEKAWSILSQNISYIKQYSGYLSKHDNRLDDVIKPLFVHGQVILFEPLGEAGMSLSDSSVSLNLDVIAKLAEYALKQKELPSEQWLGLACTIFLFHEISHCFQRLLCHRDVQAMKSVNLPLGRLIMAELDLLSDYLAAHTLSLISTLRTNDGVFNTKIYYEHLYVIWCQICKGMLEIFSQRGERRKNKLRRAFGYWLMSNLVSDAYSGNIPLGLNAELFPDWNQSHDKLSIYSGHRPWITGVYVNPTLMRKALNAISRGDNEAAALGAKQVWQSLPK